MPPYLIELISLRVRFFLIIEKIFWQLLQVCDSLGETYPILCGK
jgi:hypothetical protein